MTTQDTETKTRSNGIASTAQAMTDTFTETAEQLQKTAGDVKDQALERAQDGIDELRKGMTDVTKMARDVTEKQPLMVVAGAVAFGVLVGMALKNSR